MSGRSRPNILLCVFDALAASDCDGLVRQTSDLPVYERLQGESVVFTTAYTPCPESSPARASLFTGVDPSVHGVWTNGVELPKHIPTFPQILAEAGYVNWLVGRRQLAGVSNWTTEHSRPGEYARVEWAHGPLHRSRQNAYLAWLGETLADRYAQIFPSQPDPDDISISSEQYKAVCELPENLSFNHWVGERVCDLMSSHLVNGTADQPFLAVAAFSVGAFMGAEPECGIDNEGLNTNALKQADAALGRMLDTIDKHNIGADTVVIFTAGRGNADTEKKQGSKNTALAAMSEQSIRVPLLMRWPGQAGASVDAPVSTIDIAPSLLEFAGLPTRTSMQGTSLPAVLSGRESARDWAVSRLRRQSPDGERSWLSALRANTMKLIVDHGNPNNAVATNYSMFDLKSDPEEQQDLAEHDKHGDDLENMIDIMIDARCALENRTEPRVAKF